MDAKRHSPAADIGGSPPYSGRSRRRKKRPPGEFEPGSLRPLVGLVAASWAVIALVFWAF